MRLPPAFKHKKFALLWLGLMISQAGSQMQLWAVFWHIRDLDENPIAISGIGLARFLPVLAFSLLAGFAADRFNRRSIMFATQAVSTLAALALGIIALSGNLSLWSIYLVTGLLAATNAFDLPARQSLVPNLVPKEDLPSAYAMHAIAFNVGTILGPGLSGLVIAAWGPQYTYIINAISFLAVVVALLLMGDVPQHAPNLENRHPAQEILAGIRFIVSSPLILSSMVLDFLATFFASANTLLPYVTRDILRVGAVEYGWLAAAQSMGAVAAAFFLSQRQKFHRQGMTLLGAVLVFGLFTVLFGISRWLPLSFLLLFGIGCADAVSSVMRSTLRNLHTPDSLRGRMTGINQLFIVGGPQLGELEAGLLAQALGVPFAIISGGIATLLSAGLVMRLWPQLWKYKQQP